MGTRASGAFYWCMLASQRLMMVGYRLVGSLSSTMPVRARVSLLHSATMPHLSGVSSNQFTRWLTGRNGLGY